MTDQDDKQVPPSEGPSKEDESPPAPAPIAVPAPVPVPVPVPAPVPVPVPASVCARVGEGRDFCRAVIIGVTGEFDEAGERRADTPLSYLHVYESVADGTQNASIEQKKLPGQSDGLLQACVQMYGLVVGPNATHRLPSHSCPARPS